MKFLFLIIFTALFSIDCLAQVKFSKTKEDSNVVYVRPPLDTSLFFNWPSIWDQPFPAISNNGQYVFYAIGNIPVKSHTLVIQSLNNSWQMAVPGVWKAVFTSDSRYVIYLQPKNTLCILNLLDRSIVSVFDVTTFKLFFQKSCEYLAFQKSNDDELVLLNLATGEKNSFKNVKGFELSEDGEILVLQIATRVDSKDKITVRMVNLVSKTALEIWTGENIIDIKLDRAGRQIAFLVKSETFPKVINADTVNIKKISSSIWYYNVGMSQSIELISHNYFYGGMEVASLDHFSKDGQRLFITLKKVPYGTPKLGVVGVNIWSYRDAKLQSQQKFELNKGTEDYLGVVNVSKPNNVIRLQQDDETVNTWAESQVDDFMLMTNRKGDASENYWNKEAIATSYLVSCIDGHRKKIPISRASFSLFGKYIVGYGESENFGNLFTYEVSSGVIRNITATLPIPLKENENEMLWPRQGRGLEIAVWLEQDSAVLVYDNFDIWLIDPSCRSKPINLTNGRKNSLQFRIADKSRVSGLSFGKESVLLKAFNKETKQMGFYRLTLFDFGKPELLFKGNYLFKLLTNKMDYALKARDAEIYLLRRERADESPNIFFTTDFKVFTPVSNVYPEKSVNWFNTELIRFVTPRGIETQAILYKPQNFDSTIKYPLIFHYYEKKANELNKYPPIGALGGDLDVAWFASHGYLICLPDIHYKVGQVGQSVCETLTSAIKYLAKRSYVDKKHIGIQGHSFGAYETNFLVTHSGLFAAAVSSSGMSDLTSYAGNLWGNGMHKLEYLELRGGRLGTTPWENPTVYLKNSPIYYVGNVSTPILLVNNKMDNNVQFEQGLEFFTALRRAGKRVWMLEYDNGGHGVGGSDYKDYLLRMSQFFDHYLKGLPAPKWMTHGIPASSKGLENGFELDYEIKTPGLGLKIK